jgi:hypothetical protein
VDDSYCLLTGCLELQENTMMGHSYGVEASASDAYSLGALVDAVQLIRQFARPGGIRLYVSAHREKKAGGVLVTYMVACMVISAQTSTARFPDTRVSRP